jgi:hypothetical protein
MREIPHAMRLGMVLTFVKSYKHIFKWPSISRNSSHPQEAMTPPYMLGLRTYGGPKF